MWFVSECTVSYRVSTYNVLRDLHFILCALTSKPPATYGLGSTTPATSILPHRLHLHCTLVANKLQDNRPARLLSSEVISNLYSFTFVVALSKLSSSSHTVKASCRFSSLNCCISSECLCANVAISSRDLVSTDDSSDSSSAIFAFSSN